MTNMFPEHRGKPGTVSPKKAMQLQEIPTTPSQVNALKKKYSAEFTAHKKLALKAINKRIRDLRARKRTVRISAKSKIRDKHLDIDKAYKTRGHGSRWTELARRIPWLVNGHSNGHELPLDPLPGTLNTQVVPPEYIDGEVVDQPGGISITPAGSYTGPPPVPIRVPLSSQRLVAPLSTRQRVLLPPGQSQTDMSYSAPRRALPGPAVRPMLPPGSVRLLPPVTRDVLPTTRRISAGSSSVVRPQIGPHIRGLLPAPGQTTQR